VAVALVLCVALGVGVFVAVRRRAKIRESEAILVRVGFTVAAIHASHHDARSAQTLEQLFKFGYVDGQRIRHFVQTDDPDKSIAMSSTFLCIIDTEVTHDAWGRELVYRCPGPVHKNGWDLYSLGPNGEDDGGVGDDIGVGADLAPVTSAK
jgi:hypothetical protein